MRLLSGFLAFGALLWGQASNFTSHNAYRLRGVVVSATAPTDGQGLTFQAAGKMWLPTTLLSAAVTSINGDPTAAQVIAVGSAGTDFAIAEAGATHTINLPQADATHTGKLLNTDWSLFKAPPDSAIAFTDITTGNVSTTLHGFAPKAPNDATKFLNGVGAYTVPSNGVLSGTSGSIGGGALLAGACATGTVTVTGATTAMVATASPAGGVDPSNGGVLGVAIDARVSAADTVVVSVCSPIAGTPTAATYNVRVIK